ncbi:PhoH family protein [Aquabacterium sp. A08]|uniref:PhoH family protein n=1 Tax=Aquabacterium sp. A08 TaxID=2718532 RepID=UPI0014215942|nr:PhoH family protein [Aquabacterium sp. A08]NIC41886.1 PhoH family protein [Aquabacterium sp. A08]NIC41894.1 PhoH family protein [Aquabacterium sp. A08]
MPPLPPAPTRKAARVQPSAVNEAAAAPVPDAESAPATATPARTVPARTSRRAAATASAAPAAPAAARPRRTAAAPQPALLAAPPTPAAEPVAVASAAASAAPPTTRAPAKRKATKAQTGPTRLFVLDTNVLMHDPVSLFRFEEHDIYLPMIVLEELDSNKKGMSEVARNARQASRTLDSLAAHNGGDIAQGLPLAALGNKDASGVLFFQTEALSHTLPSGLPQGKADNQILGVVQALTDKHPGREVVLVSKDINMRIKARALGLAAEDYQNDKALDDDELLYTGALPLPADFWTRQSKTIESWQQGGHTFYRIGGPIAEQMVINQFVYFEAPGEPPLYARVTEVRGKTAVLKTLKDYTHLKNAVWGVTSRNREQNFALNLLLDPEIDFVTLAGTAGTGKTLMALAAGLTQVLDERRYTEIIMTRATVSVGEDIGFLPGTEEEKMGPWMGALDDNLEFLAKGEGGNAGEWGRAATNELVRSRIKVKSMNFMRGRTFMNKYVIIDEAQNLTPKQMKTLITRAGPGTKIICMGNLAQIDTPYLTEGSSGLTYAVDRFKGWPHGGHITLARGERSRLADFASDVL